MIRIREPDYTRFRRSKSRRLGQAGPSACLALLRALASKGFSGLGAATRILFSSKFLAIAACLVFIGAFSGYYYLAESGFNPNPQRTTLAGAPVCVPEKQSCPGFTLGNVTLRVLNRTDIDSQQMSFVLIPGGPGPMSRVSVYIDNISLGAVDGPFAPGVPKLVALGVPTTINVTPGASYGIVVQGTFAESATDYWQSVSVVATGG